MTDYMVTVGHLADRLYVRLSITGMDQSRMAQLWIMQLSPWTELLYDWFLGG